MAPKEILFNEAVQNRVAPDDDVLRKYLEDYHGDKIAWHAVHQKEDISNALFSMSFKLSDGRNGVELVTSPESKNHFELYMYWVEPKPELQTNPDDEDAENRPSN